MAKILITGDFCPIGRVSNLGKKKEYDLIYNDFFLLFKENDLNITNLECPVGDFKVPIEKVGPNLRADIDAVAILKYADFNMVTLANNHIMDYGIEGLLNTLELCKQNNIISVGAGESLTEARRFINVNIDGLKVAILNFAENEFSTTTADEVMGANPLNPIWNYYDIIEAKKQSDYVFVVVHGGHEGYQLPSPRMQDTYHFFIDAGADVIVGHHPHCYSGYELYHGKPIFYSLGNFLFDSRLGVRKDKWNEGFCVQFNLTHSEILFSIYPYKQNDDDVGLRKMNEKETEDFNCRLNVLNEIIKNRELLVQEYEKFVDSRQRSFLFFLQPYSNKYLRALFNRHLIPDIVTSTKKRMILNVVRCEAHRDVLLNLLDSK